MKESLWEFNLLRKCGLLLWLVRAQHDHYESKCEKKLGGNLFAFPLTKANAKTNLQIFICNHFCVDGNTSNANLSTRSTTIHAPMPFGLLGLHTDPTDHPCSAWYPCPFDLHLLLLSCCLPLLGDFALLLGKGFGRECLNVDNGFPPFHELVGNRNSISRRQFVCEMVAPPIAQE